MRKTGILTLTVIFLTVIILALSGCSARVVDHQQVAKNEEIVIKFSHVTAADSPKGLAATRFADLVRQRTGGYVEVQVFPNSTLYKDGEEFDALNRGAVQMLAPATSKLSGMFPDWQLLDLPYAFPNLTYIHQLMEGPVGKKLLAQLQTRKMLGLAMWDNGFKEFTNNKRPLVRPRDFQGLRFRVMPSQVLVDQFAAVGASAYPMPFNDVGQALATGMVDGEENTISNIYTQRFDRSQKYLTLSDHGYLGYVVLTNVDFWNSLPAWVQKVLRDTLAEVTVWERAEAKKVNEEQLKVMDKQGKVKIQHLTPAEKEALQKAFRPAYEHLSEEIGRSLVRSVQPGAP
ncbi:TRAP transporter substrate-binding protein [Acididesulfobacillus acetoxydans]|uniref:TRAP transporter substrate-binding protein n=1 Tax=Acididesulfobacillus acetoxydans TaxID=1561005 RepID=UPI001F0E4EBF|nr:TRAP transporter substrate-binding protein [Acididesulfobacillus acetoxydans]